MQSYEALKKRAKSGDVKSQFELGKCSNDYKEAAKWITKAAEQGYAEAINFLDTIYSDDHSANLLFDVVDRKVDNYFYDDDATAVLYDMERIWGKEDAEREGEEGEYCAMQFYVGLLYFNNNKRRRALKWWLKAAEIGTDAGKLNYPSPEDDSEECSVVLESLKRIVDSSFATGALYYLRGGGARDYEEAAKHFLKAAKENTSNDYDGLAQARIMLCSIYSEGQAPIDRSVEVLQYYFYAKINAASLEINKILSDKSTVKEIKLAYYRYHSSPPCGNLSENRKESDTILEKEKNNLIGNLAKKGIPAARYELEKAMRLYKQGAEHGYTDALYQYANIHRNNLLESQDYKKEFKWLLGQIAKFSLHGSNNNFSYLTEYDHWDGDPYNTEPDLFDNSPEPDRPGPGDDVPF